MLEKTFSLLRSPRYAALLKPSSPSFAHSSNKHLLYYKIRLLSLSKGTMKKDGPLGDGASKDQDNVDDRAAQAPA